MGWARAKRADRIRTRCVTRTILLSTRVSPRSKGLARALSRSHIASDVARGTRVAHKRAARRPRSRGAGRPSQGRALRNHVNKTHAARGHAGTQTSPQRAGTRIHAGHTGRIPPARSEAPHAAADSEPRRW
jgi:hypothetical protein